VTQDERNDQAAVRDALLAERDRLQHDIYTLTRGDEAALPTTPEDDLDEPKGDEGDQAEPLVEYERNVQALDALRAELVEVNAALARLENSTYGTCLRCGKQIDPRRLRSMPWASCDAECQHLIDLGLAHRPAGS
jgi:DnaK suppressor protein